MFRQLYGIKQLTTITKCDSANVQNMPKAYLTPTPDNKKTEKKIV